MDPHGDLAGRGVSVPVLGRLGGPGHQRRVIVGGLAACVVGALLAALPLAMVGLLVGRVLQGVAVEWCRSRYPQRGR